MKFSIIIPTYNREEHTLATVYALLRQDTNEKYEIIVIDDGSHKKSSKLRKLHDNGDVNYKYYKENKGRAIARNKGIDIATGEYIIFIDSGVVPQSNYLFNVCEAVKSNSNDILIGITKGFSDNELPTALHNFVNEETYQLQNHGQLENMYDCREEQYRKYGKCLKNYKAPWVYAWTNNLILRRNHILKYGKFDENFKGWGGEDTELMIRLYYNGIDIELAENCICIDLPHKKDNEIDNQIEYERIFKERQKYIINKHDYFETRVWSNTFYTELEEVLNNDDLVHELEYHLETKVLIINKHYLSKESTLNEILDYFEKNKFENTKLIIKTSKDFETLSDQFKTSNNIEVEYIERKNSIVFSDIDGTLVGQDFTISDEIKKKLIEDNTNIVLCSGRPIFEQKKLGINCDMIGLNGAEYLKNNKYFSVGAMSETEVFNIIEYLKEENYVFTMHTSEGKYIEKNVALYPLVYNLALLHSEENDEVLKGINIYHQIIYTNSIKYSDEEITEFQNSKIFKIEIYTELDKLDAIKKIKTKFPNYNVFSTHISNIEITPDHIEKGRVISDVFSQHNTLHIGVGDGENDISMFKHCDISIAMGNAHPKCKRASKYIVSEESENGFIEALNIVDGYKIKEGV